MMKRILVIFFVLMAMILPASAAKTSSRHKHVAARGHKSKSKVAVHKSTHRRKKLAKR
jgi:hypothetical protein